MPLLVRCVLGLSAVALVGCGSPATEGDDAGSASQDQAATSEPAPEGLQPQDQAADDDAATGNDAAAEGEQTTPDVSAPLERIDHGGRYWAVLWVGDFGDPALDRVREALAERWGPGVDGQRGRLQPGRR